MTFPTVFANLAAGNQPASLLDNMYNIVGAMGSIPCSATGTNAITLTPLPNYYLPAAYASYQLVTFAVPNSLTGLATIRIGALAFVKLFMPSGLQANSGDLVAGGLVIAAFSLTLDSGNGGFLVINASTPSVIQPVMGTFKNLSIVNGGTPDTTIVVTADELMLENAASATAKVSNLNLTINTTINGAGGLDTGAMAANTFYSVWVIFNSGGPTTAGMISPS